MFWGTVLLRKGGDSGETVFHPQSVRLKMIMKPVRLKMDIFSLVAPHTSDSSCADKNGLDVTPASPSSPPMATPGLSPTTAEADGGTLGKASVWCVMRCVCGCGGLAFSNQEDESESEYGVAARHF